jgi:2-polyprenylphenol 6-hydroxylase
MSAPDVVIVGGGVVGTCLALALRAAGVKITLIESRPPSATLDEQFDHRIYTLSPASITFLEQLDVWRRMDGARIAPVYAMEVWGDEDSRIEFSADQANLPRLAVTVENGRLLQALWQALHECADIEIVTDAAPSALTLAGTHPRIEMDDGRAFTPELVVGADGADSWVRSQAQVATQETRYEELGLVANFACEKAHRGVARQWFRADGVLAWLPLPGERISIVWSTALDHAKELAALPPAELCERVADAGFETLGELKLISPVATFPLRRIEVADWIRPGLALTGDAAHTVHPLAGQGVNLGLQDARELAHTLTRRAPPEGCGDVAVLRRYERGRREDTRAMHWMTHGLHALFSPARPGLRTVRNMGLDLVDRQAWLKRKLIARAIG